MAKELRFSCKEIRAFMTRTMPACPAAYREGIIHQVSKRGWSDCTLAKAVGIASHNYIRHNLTDYERWLDRHGLTREEARLIVKAELDDIFRSWQVPATASEKDEARCAS